ncbi:hypothetical protein BFJ66_g992 [Fusarium oxysporum f. sp. cepae]|uniref:Uncharacterized protein n=1 Tax=Fusarium oxysporum f. sp. cepae TaxID=396571 RepID=A0A3L6NIH5_FUSOX|nr:hypothetical protein BFJ65_g8306 [Fusarium oxysporum f. sp. cepae]RKK62184.1 hypothetical protein BFJ66_g992 [Fusarium oxysporum f. sp. cepae]RKK64440.1 hypothetical protein BFJ67_g399 [Fusarium oxysporum f. sp. cepae]
MKVAKDPFSGKLLLGKAMSKHICDAFTRYDITGVNFSNSNSYLPGDNGQFWADIPLGMLFFSQCTLDRTNPAGSCQFSALITERLFHKA